MLFNSRSKPYPGPTLQFSLKCSKHKTPLSTETGANDGTQDRGSLSNFSQQNKLS